MSEEVYRLSDGRLEQIRTGIEGLDTGAYYGADMLSAALLDKNLDASDLLEEVDRLRAIEERLKEAVAVTREVVTGLRQRGDEKWELGNRRAANYYHDAARLKGAKLEELEKILEG